MSAPFCWQFWHEWVYRLNMNPSILVYLKTAIKTEPHNKMNIEIHNKKISK